MGQLKISFKKVNENGAKCEFNATVATL